MKSKLFKLLI